MARIECGDARSLLDERFSDVTESEAKDIIDVLEVLVPGISVTYDVVDGWVVEEPK